MPPADRFADRFQADTYGRDEGVQLDHGDASSAVEHVQMVTRSEAVVRMMAASTTSTAGTALERDPAVSPTFVVESPPPQDSLISVRVRAAGRVPEAERSGRVQK